jgi:hypothetical protein
MLTIQWNQDQIDAALDGSPGLFAALFSPYELAEMMQSAVATIEAERILCEDTLQRVDLAFKLMEMSLSKVDEANLRTKANLDVKVATAEKETSDAYEKYHEAMDKLAAGRREFYRLTGKQAEW